jgi:glycosyltransferase involved in cell wall biosynthesis
VKASILKKPNISLIKIRSHEKGIWRLINLFSSLFLSKSDLGDEYRVHICIDPHGLILCNSLFPKVFPAYYSLELYFRHNYFNLSYPPDVMKRERQLIGHIKALIIQSEERERLFREEYELPPETPSFLLPVTYLSPSCATKSLLLRKKYLIADDKRLALHLGGIQEYHSCIELAQAFSKLKDWVLIFHGFSFGDYIARLKEVLKQRSISNVIISEDTYELIEQMDPILMSCDVGIAWYNDVSPNFSSAGKSSGKISAYLRFGLPVIAKKYPSTVEAIEDTGCGCCVDHFAEIPRALAEILSRYDTYEKACRAEYDRFYWFERYRESLHGFIETNAVVNSYRAG